MPTKNPRINVTLTTHRHELLRRMSSVSGQSMSAILVDMFESVAPVFERAVAVAEQAAAARGEVKDGIRLAAEEAERQMMPLLQSATHQLDMFVGTVTGLSAEQDRKSRSGPLARAKARQRPAGNRSASPKPRPDPRPVITGVRSLKKGQKKGRRR